MLRAIYAIEVQRGDVVQHNMYMPRAIARVSQEKNARHLEVIKLTDQSNDTVSFDPYDVLILHHRPSEQSEHQLLATLDAAAERVRQVLREDEDQHILDHLADPDVAIAALREAIDAYELSKSPEPTRNESLVDRHMIP
jgi:hypothetical protein